MATITANKITDLGLSSSMTTCNTGGDNFVNTGIEFIRVQNAHASQDYTVKVTVQSQSYKHPTYGNLTKDHIYKSVSSVTSGLGSNSILIGPFKQKPFNTSTNMVEVSYKNGTHTTDTAFNAASDIGSGAHLLKIEVLYLEN